jgi:hypothetical protein
MRLREEEDTKSRSHLPFKFNIDFIDHSVAGEESGGEVSGLSRLPLPSWFHTESMPMPCIPMDDDVSRRLWRQETLQQAQQGKADGMGT